MSLLLHTHTHNVRISPLSLTHADGDVDAEVAVVGEELCDVGVEDEAVAGHDGRLDAVVDAARGRLPRQPPPVAVQLQSEKREEQLYVRKQR